MSALASDADGSSTGCAALTVLTSVVTVVVLEVGIVILAGESDERVLFRGLAPASAQPILGSVQCWPPRPGDKVLL